MPIQIEIATDSETMFRSQSYSAETSDIDVSNTPSIIEITQ